MPVRSTRGLDCAHQATRAREQAGVAAATIVSSPTPPVRSFGGCAATHPTGTVPAHPLLAMLPRTPWVVVTVPALVLCARLLGWSREVATTSLVTGPCLIPFGRLHVASSLLPPRCCYVLSFLLLEVL